MARRRAEMDQNADVDYDSGDDWFLPSTVNRNMTLLTSSSSSCLVTSTHGRSNSGSDHSNSHGNSHPHSRTRGAGREGGRHDDPSTTAEQQQQHSTRQQRQQNRTPSDDGRPARSGALTSPTTSSSSCSRTGSTSSGVGSTDARTSRASIVDDLLFDIYDRWHCRRYSYDSDTTYTEYSSTSEAVFYRSDSVQSAFDDKQSAQYQRKYLQTKDISELRQIRSELRHRVSKNSARLIRQLKNRDRHLVKASRNCDIITAILQASSLKRRIDSKIRFSIEPLPGEEAFEQWRDAMKAVARLPLGIPTEFRKKVWLALADNYIKKLKIDWEQTKRLAFNDRSNPDDNRLGLQIVKDLHRTGCSGFSGTGNEQDRAVLKRVLLAYARWNKKVGYCQGFNVLAALLLDVMDRKEDDALKVMIYLVDYVLPESYFANNLRALSVDMAVFRDLLHIQLPQLSKHLDQLQTAARDDKTGANYEPPLTNVFTMQWFLTLFATCLPKPTALRVWDSVLLEGSEILLRTAVAIWGKLQKHIKLVQSADEFYTVMGTLSHKMLSCNMIEADSLIKMVYSMGPLPMPQLTELREKYTYNITPFTAAMSSEHTHVCSDDDDFDDDDFVENINCFGGMFPPQSAPPRALGEVDKARSGSSFDISKASPGAYAANPEELGPLASAYAERMSLDINQLKQQYKKLRQRQKQAHIILAAASARHYSFKHSSPASKEQKTPKHHSYVTPVQAPVAVNHLFIGRQQMRALRNNANLVEGTNIVKMHPENNGSITGQTWPASKKERQEAHLQQYRKTRQRGSVDSDDRQMEDRQAVNHQDKRSRSPSADSSISGTSTLKSSGSVSDVSTCGVESECPQSDTESSTSERLSGQDLIIFNDDEQGHQTPEGSTKQSDQVECQSSQENDSNNMDNKDKDSTKLECASSSDVDDADKDNNSSSVGDKEDTDHETELVTVDKNLIDANVAGQQTTEPARKENISKSSSPDTEQKHGMNTKQCASALDSVGKSPANGEKLREENKTNSDKMEVCYVTSLTYKGHKVVQAPNDKISTDGSSTCHDTATVHQDTNRQLNDSGLKSTNTPPGAIPDQPIKLFNPFPGQHVNSRRMKNGVKLGLYSANDIPRLKTGITKANMTKSQAHNVLQHRQYLARN